LYEQIFYKFDLIKSSFGVFENEWNLKKDNSNTIIIIATKTLWNTFSHTPKKVRKKEMNERCNNAAANADVLC
jgi:hypothetical protein